MTTTADTRPRILFVDDEDLVLRFFQRLFTARGYAVATASRGADAIAMIRREPAFDVVVSDIRMPEMDGLELLRAIRTHDLDVSVVFMTGMPTLESAIKAIELGATSYLQKPCETQAVEAAISRAIKLRRVTRAKRELFEASGESAAEPRDRAGLEATFDRVMKTLWIAYQPIFSVTRKRVYGYEALMRAEERALPHPGAILDAAMRLGRLHELSRTLRRLAANPPIEMPDPCALFVNVHPHDLHDDAVYDPLATLSRLGTRVVLEITERAVLDDVDDLPRRIRDLRSMGFRIAVDDLGAGYAGLSSVAVLEPEVVKLDMSLVRNVQSEPMKRKLVRAVVDLCRETNTEVIAEGVETIDEAKTLVDLGCDLLQGYFLARPGRAFPELTAAAIEWAGNATAAPDPN